MKTKTQKKTEMRKNKNRKKNGRVPWLVMTAARLLIDMLFKIVTFMMMIMIMIMLLYTPELLHIPKYCIFTMCKLKLDLISLSFYSRN